MGKNKRTTKSKKHIHHKKTKITRRKKGGWDNQIGKQSSDINTKAQNSRNILLSSFTKQRLHILFIMNLCVLYNVYIEGDEGVKLYTEEVDTIITTLRGILNNTNQVLNEYFGSDIFNDNIVFETPITDVPILTQTVDEKKTNANISQVNKAVEQEIKKAENVFEVEEMNIKEPQTGGDGDYTKLAEKATLIIDPNIEILEDEVKKNDTISLFIDNLTKEMNEKSLLIKTKLSLNSFSIGNEINLFIRLVVFLSNYLKLVEKAKTDGIVQPADEKGRTIILKFNGFLGRTKITNEFEPVYEVLKKGYDLGQSGIQYFTRKNDKQYGGRTWIEFANEIVSRSNGFFWGVDSKNKEKYSFLLYFKTFLTMYQDNTLIKVELMNKQSNSWAEYAYNTIIIPYRFASKNPYFGNFLITLTAATNAVFWGRYICPPLALYVEPLAITAKIITISLLPMLEPSKIMLYKQTEIDIKNKEIQSHSMIDENISNISDSYLHLSEELLSSELKFTLMEDENISSSQK